MDPYFFGIYAIIYTLLLVWGIFLLFKKGRPTYGDVLLVVIAGLIYDNSILAAGRIAGESDMLLSLNRMRFILHAAATPLLVLFAWYAAKESGARVLDQKKSLGIAWIITIVLMSIEFFAIRNLQLEAVTEYGVLKYAPLHAHGPPIMVIGVSVFLLISGVIVWKKTGWFWMFAGIAIMAAGSAVPFDPGSAAVTNLFELILIASLLLTKKYLDRNAV
ncbi:hypothetical protein B14911_28070 [Bacillus sp. NRRL B-14911]|uniref:Phospholipid phosphatase n=2 Tax=Bacillus infantis TaxID=324767 RepID=U5L948_9BACI|nr:MULTISPECIES: hypothetical protein [Bacillus]AGX04359.1 hypothetical protein N288_12265 [Bacillus infantis NRRL B-14911]EAR66939.1 hypothetical protein B14911_28070 [Bacillus sp. NRRL B-14911]MDT0158933.1 phospholipid phosphatase [Bacillus sp. AG4(2022)]